MQMLTPDDRLRQAATAAARGTLTPAGSAPFLHEGRYLTVRYASESGLVVEDTTGATVLELTAADVPPAPAAAPAHLEIKVVGMDCEIQLTTTQAEMLSRADFETQVRPAMLTAGAASASVTVDGAKRVTVCFSVAGKAEAAAACNALSRFMPDHEASQELPARSLALMLVLGAEIGTDAEELAAHVSYMPKWWEVQPDEKAHLQLLFDQFRHRGRVIDFHAEYRLPTAQFERLREIVTDVAKGLDNNVLELKTRAITCAIAVGGDAEEVKAKAERMVASSTSRAVPAPAADTATTYSR